MERMLQNSQELISSITFFLFHVLVIWLSWFDCKTVEDQSGQGLKMHTEVIVVQLNLRFKALNLWKAE